MINYIYVTNLGEIVGSGVAQDVEHINPIKDTQIILGVPPVTGFEYYYSFSQKKTLPLPPKPGADYKFNYTNKQWEIDLEAASTSARALRDKLLAESDYTQYTDVVLANKAEWATYRQALRDITKQSGFPTNITWPTKPT